MALIDMDIAIEELDKWFFDRSDVRGPKQVIMDLPTVEPERKQGKWISRENNLSCVRYNRWKCSECGNGVEYRTNYCPNCGADMRGGQDDK